MAIVLSGLWRDLKFGMRLLRVLRLFSDLDPTGRDTITADLEAIVDANPDAVAFVFEGHSITYRNLDRRANRVAHWALGQNLRSGDCVALNLENCPDFVAVWYGLSKVGVTCALINTNLKDEGLEHCINIVEANAVIAAGKQAERSASCLAKRDHILDVWDFDGGNGRDFEAALAGQKEVRPSATHRQSICSGDTALYIYTSGTTGLPKAARITHNKLRGTGRIAKALVQIKKTDRVYNALPLYHITGGGIGLIGPLSVGASVILKRRFSASEFWQDIADNRATLFVYIGELCRYLVNAAPHPLETSHSLRAGFGNGLRAEVWRSFVERFKVPTMRELYGSTEGNVSFLNLDGTVGAIGQMPPWMGRRIGMELVQFDIEKERPRRGADGFCIRAEVNVPGEAIGKISDSVRQEFNGYHDPKATAAKILTDVFEPGDKWFRTGDLIRRDADNYLYFVDRVGDTFRWKGENVATNEVSDCLSKYPGIDLANVYGVEIPRSEGRAGMAAITVTEAFSSAGLLKYLSSHLPAYAIPLFIRIQSEADTTGTFKFKKVDLVKAGFDLAAVEDPILFWQPGTEEYTEFEQQHQEQLVDGQYRF